MKKCIYTLKDDGEFSKEHIFPKGIGGNKTLSKDWISKEFNDLMSPLERKFLRENPLIAIWRMFEGPCGRKNHEGKVGINFIKESTTSELELGYIEKGQPISIPQFIFPYPIPVNDLPCQSINIRDKSEIVSFANKLKNCNNKFETIKTPDNSFMDKISIGIVNERIYVGAHDQLNEEQICNQLKIISSILLTNLNSKPHTMEIKKTKSPVEYHSYFRDNIEWYRVAAKIAFNCFAHIKGHEFVLKEEFNKIRYAIVTGENIEDLTTLCDPSENEFVDKLNLSNNEHFAIFLQNNKGLCGQVGFYGGNPLYGITLSKSAIIDFGYEPLGYVCDWKNKQSYFFHIDDCLNCNITRE